MNSKDLERIAGLNRRHFLKGLGACLAVPAFESLPFQSFAGPAACPAARGFLRRHKVNYVSVRDGTDHTYSAYGLTGVPETYFIDANGRTLRHFVGAASRQDLEDGIRKLLGS